MLELLNTLHVNRLALRYGFPSRIEYTAYDGTYKVHIGCMLFDVQPNFNTNEPGFPICLVHDGNVIKHYIQLDQYLSQALKKEAQRV